MPTFDQIVTMDAPLADVWQEVRYGWDGWRDILTEVPEKLLIARHSNCWCVYLLWTSQNLRDGSISTKLRLVATTHESALAEVASAAHPDLVMNTLTGDIDDYTERWLLWNLEDIKSKAENKPAPAPKKPVQTTAWKIPEDLFLLRPANFGVISGVWQPDAESVDNLIYKLVLPVVLVVIFVLFGIGMIYEDIHLLVLKTATTPGEVVFDEAYPCGKNRRYTCYPVNYRYEVDHQTYWERQLYRSEPSFADGDSVMVTYSIFNPGISVIGRPVVNIVTLMIAVFMLVFAGIAWMVIQLITRDERRYRHEGHIIYGTLLRIDTQIHNREFWITAHYEFLTPSGEPVRKFATRKRDDLRDKALPTSGTVAVQFVDRSLYRLL